MMDAITKTLLEQTAGLHEIPQGAYNIRQDGKLLSRNCNEQIQIVSKQDKDGIDIIISPNTHNQSVHIPVIITQGGLNDLVYNDFYIGENCDVLIVAGCGIHNDTNQNSRHDGIHTFHIGKNAKVKYVEKHLGIGQNTGEKNLNPTTRIEMETNSCFTMETVQLGGVNYADRKTTASLQANATLVINEKILTTNQQKATTDFTVELLGDNAKVEVTSRSVAKDNSYQAFNSNIIGKAQCFGHVECDGILADHAVINSTPQISAQNVNATLVHEAAIGKISADQLIKLMTLGLTQAEAEQQIINGFLS
ncbi:MAG: SufD family Fe-S cluster assembly protein [Clostridia bacterium]|nr:SufD family Fe-S cluster assembly protein [Clostridia bacterium]